ncbi:MAG: V-type ATP synthase subunit D, partial [Spirochaetota bacterium]
MPVEPTKANLIRFREELRVAEEGYDILDRKREILMQECAIAAARHKAAKEKSEEMIKEIYRLYRKFISSVAPRTAAYARIHRPDTLVLKTHWTRIMGVHIPRLSIDSEKIPFHSLGLPGRECDTLTAALKKAVPALAEYAQSSLALSRLSDEMARTRKRLKALENIHIPAYTGAISFITAALEENERDELI